MSGNVVTDPAYWETVAAYLATSGVATFEQDWLNDNAHTDFNLTDARRVPGQHGGLDGPAKPDHAILHGFGAALSAELEVQQPDHDSHQRRPDAARALDGFPVRVAAGERGGRVAVHG